MHKEECPTTVNPTFQESQSPSAERVHTVILLLLHVVARGPEAEPVCADVVSTPVAVVFCRRVTDPNFQVALWCLS